ncbi:L,D-transpeptidase family protein [Ferriphaselus sp. R-1]|uniref:L,D-transpeptidase family protein n=1 Tax=Ferriphaselus sp. R-1 TaxID=1485544 RepID=UPI0005550903|nr:L,D-transpeptidase family protein [Ferriphaselus sp. R-1]
MTKRLRLSLLAALLAIPAMAMAESRSLEAQLAHALLALKEGHMDAALREADALVKANPNFRLAQLVKADLLMARAKPLTGFGNASGAPHDKIEDLRSEAQARLQRYQDQTPVSSIPKHLWKLDPEQKHALVVDASRSTLYVFENVDNEPRYVTDYYISIGKSGADKTNEGDKRTPIGVYYVKDSLPASSLTDFYGVGAFPLSYPNEWDIKHGRSGHGIWIHGTPSDTYSRPPLASSGCVVLANDDLNRLSKMLQIGKTPVVITNQMEWSDDKDKAERDALLKEIEHWRTDWSSRDTEAYLKHYARNFYSEDMDYAAWASHKGKVNAGKAWIKVEVNNLSVFPYPGTTNMAVVNFEQDYSSNNLNNKMKKRQYWIKQGERWQILYEGAA